jgi:lysophospholipase L1-like esterase
MLRLSYISLPVLLCLACSEGSTPSPFDDSNRGADRSDDDGSADDDAADDDAADDDAADDDTSTSDGGPQDDDAASSLDDGAGGSGSMTNPSPPTCQPGDPSAFPSPMPSPRISLGKPVFASEGVENPEGLVDGDYHNSATITRFGMVTEDAPAWAAIDLGEGPSRLFVLWQDASYLLYDDPSQGSPGAYRIEVSADSTDGRDGNWELREEVTDNRVRARAHTVDFEGMRWLRFTFLGVSDDSSRGEINIDEIAVHDISGVDDDRIDAWFFLGDSITQGAFKRDIPEQQMFDEVVAAEQPDHFPAMVNGGIGGELLSDALARIDQVLLDYPNFPYVAVAFGTNDEWGNQNVTSASFETRLVELVDRLIAAGRTPILARIPFADDGAHETLPDFNAVIDRVREEYDLPCGPDLYGWFWENRNLLGDDKVHPIQKGYIEINRLWAEAAAAYDQSE